jgi:hypothetical protein
MEMAGKRKVELKLPPKKFMIEKKGLVSQKAQTRYIRKSIIGQLQKRGFYYVRVHSYQDYLETFKFYFGELLKQDKTNHMILALNKKQESFLENVMLIVIDSPTWLLIPQLKDPHATGKAYKDLYASLAQLSELAHKYEFAAIITLQLISEMSEILKQNQDGVLTSKQQKVLSTLQEVVEKRDYVGGKAAMHASTVNIRFKGDQNPRKAWNVKNRSMPTGELNSILFEVEDIGLIDFIEG